MHGCGQHRNNEIIPLNKFTALKIIIDIKLYSGGVRIFPNGFCRMGVRGIGNRDMPFFRGSFLHEVTYEAGRG
jgi:hypothetical protein